MAKKNASKHLEKQALRQATELCAASTDAKQAKHASLSM
jgi:hypothetical protein